MRVDMLHAGQLRKLIKHGADAALLKASSALPNKQRRVVISTRRQIIPKHHRRDRVQIDESLLVAFTVHDALHARHVYIAAIQQLHLANTAPGCFQKIDNGLIAYRIARQLDPLHVAFGKYFLDDLGAFHGVDIRHGILRDQPVAVQPVKVVTKDIALMPQRLVGQSASLALRQILLDMIWRHMA